MTISKYSNLVSTDTTTEIAVASNVVTICHWVYNYLTTRTVIGSGIGTYACTGTHTGIIGTGIITITAITGTPVGVL